MEQEIERIKKLFREKVSKQMIQDEIGMLISEYGIDIIDKMVFIECQFGKSA